MVINTDELIRITKERNLDIAKSKNLGWSFGKLDKEQQTNPIKSATIKADYEPTRNLVTVGLGVNF